MGDYKDHVVYVPFNEPEGNMFGSGAWSYNNVFWLNNPQHFFEAWKETYHLTKGLDPDARIAGRIRPAIPLRAGDHQVAVTPLTEK